MFYEQNKKEQFWSFCHQDRLLPAELIKHSESTFVQMFCVWKCFAQQEIFLTWAGNVKIEGCD
jgi:hypothetical protein